MTECIVQNWLAGAGLAPKSQMAYLKEVAAFADYIGIGDVSRLADFIDGQQGVINEVVSKYLKHKKDLGRGLHTLNRSLSVIKSFVGYLKSIGYVDCVISIKAKLPDSAHDRQYVPDDLIAKIYEVAADNCSPRTSARDRLVLFLIYSMLLDNHEIINLTVGDVDIENLYLKVDGSYLDIPEGGGGFFEDWLRLRRWQEQSDPLLVSGRGGRLSGSSVYSIVRELGSFAGVRINPRTLKYAGRIKAMQRSSSIGEFLDLARVRSIQV